MATTTRAAKTLFLVQMAIWIAIEAIFAFFPFLGTIPIGPIEATLAHIPVIIVAISLGLKAGTIMGGCFGILSLISYTVRPTIPAGIMFSPVISIQYANNTGEAIFYAVGSILIAVLPRVLVGVNTALIYRLMKRKLHAPSVVSAGVAGLIGTMTNTVLVVCGTYLFFHDVSILTGGFNFLAFFIAMTGVNFIMEAITAVVISSAAIVPLEKLNLRQARTV